MIEEQTSYVRSAYTSTFMSKVFFFFGLAIAASAGGVYIGLNYLAEYFIASPAIIYLLMFVELILIFTSRLWSKRPPLSYLLFITFAVITGLTLVPVMAYLTASPAGVGIVLKAFTATSLMFAATAIFGYTTNYNLQGLGGFLFFALIGMIIISVMGIFLPWGNSFEMLFAGFGVLLFSGYTMYDIQRLKHYPDDAYIDAAIQLYLDIFNMFIFILRLLMAFDRD